MRCLEFLVNLYGSFIIYAGSGQAFAQKSPVNTLVTGALIIGSIVIINLKHRLDKISTVNGLVTVNNFLLYDLKNSNNV